MNSRKIYKLKADSTKGPGERTHKHTHKQMYNTVTYFRTESFVFLKVSYNSCS